MATTIANDQALREVLHNLPAQQQRVLGARFARHVAHLCRDERVLRAIETGTRADASAMELEDAFRAARAYAARTYTECGRETDWLAQADHFVAAAAAAALTPDAMLAEKQPNRAWKAALQARMAVNCAMMEDETVSENTEIEHQYALAGAPDA